MTDSNDNLMTGHVYDGIQEYDNPLPGWWTAIFWGSIVFAVCYLFVALVRSDWIDTEQLYEQSVTAELERQFAELGELQPDRATLLSFLQDEEKSKWLRVGAAVFQTNCVSCHGRDGSGVSGPNMTDDHYILVRTLTDIPKTITNGSLAAGMPAWGNRLSENEIILVGAYIASLRGQNLPSAMGEQGELIPAWDVEPPSAEAAPASKD